MARSVLTKVELGGACRVFIANNGIIARNTWCHSSEVDLLESTTEVIVINDWSCWHHLYCCWQQGVMVKIFSVALFIVNGSLWQQLELEESNPPMAVSSIGMDASGQWLAEIGAIGTVVSGIVGSGKD